MKPIMMSIGYERATIDAFVESLKSASVDVLVDVREFPISRKKGFSKSLLQTHLEDAGLEYRHFKTLGSPKALRHTVRQDRDYSAFFEGVRQHLASKQGQDAIEVVAEIGRQRNACLMCFCRCWEQCHRRIVLEALLDAGNFRIRHLSVGDGDRPLFEAA